MTRRPLHRQTVTLLRDARGRFTRVRATLTVRTQVRTRRRLRRLVLARGEQLALF